MTNLRSIPTFEYLDRKKSKRRVSIAQVNGDVLEKIPEDELGSGGFGEVTKFRSRAHPNKVYAIKKEIPHYKDKFLEAKKFERGALVFRILHGEGAFSGNSRSTKDPHYQLMTFFDGKNLSEYEVKSYHDFIYICILATVALMELHRFEIYHLDFQPRNIMICEEKDRIVAKLIDFDLSLFKGEAGKVHRSDWTPPETTITTPALVDIYGLGWTLQKKWKESFIPKDSYLDDFFAKMQAREPSDRPSLVDIYLFFLKIWLELSPNIKIVNALHFRAFALTSNPDELKAVLPKTNFKELIEFDPDLPIFLIRILKLDIMTCAKLLCEEEKGANPLGQMFERFPDTFHCFKDQQDSVNTFKKIISDSSLDEIIRPLSPENKMKVLDWFVGALFVESGRNLPQALRVADRYKANSHSYPLLVLAFNRVVYQPRMQVKIASSSCLFMGKKNHKLQASEALNKFGDLGATGKIDVAQHRGYYASGELREIASRLFEQDKTSRFVR